MSALILLLAGLSFGSTGSALAAPIVARAQGIDSVEQLRRWTEKIAKKADALTPEDQAKATEVLADVRLLQIARPDRRQEIVLALLDVALLAPPPGAPAPVRGRAQIIWSDDFVERTASTAREALERVFEADPEIASWIGTAVLAAPKAHSKARRLLALELLADLESPASLPALFTCASGNERELRDAAMEALVGWEDESVHQFMLRQLERSRDDPDWIVPGTVRRHFALTAPDPAGQASKDLTKTAGNLLAEKDWRDALRGLSLSSALDESAGVPLLIEALTEWCRRAQEGEGSRRVEGALAKELQRRLGRSFGPSPQRWAAYWESVRSGAVSRGPVTQPEQGTHAGFFGLRPLTDRVVFVLDNSGSMDKPFGPGGARRWDEAVTQMLHYLRGLGERTNFRVVLFSAEVETWHPGLKPATEENLRAVETWLRAKKREGGTRLRPAIEHVLHVGRDGERTPGRVEEDTVVVLCDGATEEGPSWVEPLLRRVNDETFLVFHTVQIDAGGDGTLELLAEETGGEFARVVR